MLTSYLRKDVKYIKGIQQIKLALESHLLSLVTRIYKVTTLDKTCRKGFVFTRF